MASPITDARPLFVIFVYCAIFSPVLSKRIWTIAMGTDISSHEYLDENGYLQGVGVDYLTHVCAEAGMDCRIVVAPKAECWQTNPGHFSTAGRGIMGGWFDACLGWLPTVQRIHTLTFSIPYYKAIPGTFFIKKGKQFDTTNLNGKTIGFKSGAFVDPYCLARQNNIKNNVLSQSQIIYRNTVNEIIDIIQNGEVDAFFGLTLWLTPAVQQQLDFIHTDIICSIGGPGLMARKDSPIIAAWNIGARKLTNSAKFSRLCDEAAQTHGHKGPVTCEEN